MHPIFLVAKIPRTARQFKQKAAYNKLLYPAKKFQFHSRCYHIYDNMFIEVVVWRINLNVPVNHLTYRQFPMDWD